MNILGSAQEKLVHDSALAWDAHHEKVQAIKDKYECEHERTELRKKVYSTGIVHYVMQCQRCGARASTAIAKAKALAANRGMEPPAFDELLRKTWDSRRDAELKMYFDAFKHDTVNRHDGYRERYHEYLQSTEWRLKREKVLQRCRGICEGCMKHQAREVHHLTYKHVGDELLYELVALCGECHGKVHGAQNDAS